MFERKQFTFYESFFSAISRIKDSSERAETYDAICAYALYGTLPDLDALPVASAIAFELIRPTLDTSRRKAKSGQAGGKSKQSVSKDEANSKQTVSKLKAKSSEDEGEKEGENEKEKEIEKEIEVENECYIEGADATVPTPDPVAVVLSDYLNRINPTASPSSLEELRSYAEDMGKDVCIRAFDIALDNKKTTWPYIRAILRDKLQRGVKCLADWDALEAEREKAKPGHKNEPQDYGDPEDFYK